MRPMEESMIPILKEKPLSNSHLRIAAMESNIGSNKVGLFQSLQYNPRQDEKNNIDLESTSFITAETEPIQTLSSATNQGHNSEVNNTEEHACANLTKNLLEINRIEERKFGIDSNNQNLVAENGQTDQLSGRVDYQQLCILSIQHRGSNERNEVHESSSPTIPDTETINNTHHQGETSSSLPKNLSLLSLPGVTDRRKVLSIGEFNMTSFNTLNSDDVSTEIGSESHPSSVGSRSDHPPPSIPAVVNEDDPSKFTFPSFLQRQSSHSTPMSEDSHQSLSRHEAGSSMTNRCNTVKECVDESSALAESADDDATPENRFLHGSSNEAFSAELPWRELRHQVMGLLAGEATANRGASENSSAPLLIPNIRNVREVAQPTTQPLEIPGIGSHTNSNGGVQLSTGLTIPGLFCAQTSPLKPTTKFLPWRIMYVPTGNSSSSGIPNSHECLTDDTTADGCQDYDDDDDELEDSSTDSSVNGNESDLELPPGVSKKVRFLPVQDSAVHEYEKFDWGAEEEEAGVFINLIVEPDSEFNDSNNEAELLNNDNDVEANPIEMFIPLIGANRRSIEIESSSSSPSSESSLDEQPLRLSDKTQGVVSPQTQRHSVELPLGSFQGETNNENAEVSQQIDQDQQQQRNISSKNSGSFSTDSGRSCSRSSSSNRRSKTIKGRESTPHPCRLASRTSSIASLSMNEISSRSKSSYECTSSETSSGCYRSHCSEQEEFSSSTARSPFFPYIDDCFPVELPFDLLPQCRSPTDGKHSSKETMYNGDDDDDDAMTDARDEVCYATPLSAHGRSDFNSQLSVDDGITSHSPNILSFKWLSAAVNDDQSSSSTCSALSSGISSNFHDVSASPVQELNIMLPNSISSFLPLYPSRIISIVESDLSSVDSGEFLTPSTVEHTARSPSERMTPSLRRKAGESLLFGHFVSSPSSFASSTISEFSPQSRFSLGIKRSDSLDEDDQDELPESFVSHDHCDRAIRNKMRYQSISIKSLSSGDRSAKDSVIDDDFCCFETPKASSNKSTPTLFGLDSSSKRVSSLRYNSAPSFPSPLSIGNCTFPKTIHIEQQPKDEGVGVGFFTSSMDYLQESIEDTRMVKKLKKSEHH